jgi:hypothetical protein
MKKLNFVVAALAAIMANGAYAHHAAEGMLDDATYDMVEENIGDSPHLDMETEDLLGSSMDSVDVGSGGGAADMGEVAADTDIAMDTTDTVDTIDLMDTVVEALAP